MAPLILSQKRKRSEPAMGEKMKNTRRKTVESDLFSRWACPPITRASVCWMIGCCIAWFGFTSAALGASDIVILGEGNAFWSNNLNSPVCRAMLGLRQTHTFRSVDFTPNGDWAVLFGGTGLYTNNPNVPAFKKLAEFLKTGGAPNCAAIAPTGGW